MFEIKTTTSQNQQKWEPIAALDLRSVKERFLYKKGWWWSLWNDPNQLEKEYRQFLYLIVLNPHQTVVPWSQNLDDFWHEHILDTQKYATDCKWILGNFIHHNPHLPHGTREHADASRATQTMYRAAFKDRAKRKTRIVDSSPGCSSNMHVVFCASKTSHATGHHTHHDAGGHHTGMHGGAHDAGGHAPSCGGHGGGHTCGGHGCGGHGGH